MKKNGFTLVELLAVIVILAIIALIAVPVFLGIINNSKKNSDKEGVNLYTDTVEKAIQKKQMSDPNFMPDKCTIKTDGNLECFSGTTSLGTVKVTMKGTKPTSGTIYITEDDITYENIVLNGKTYYEKEAPTFNIGDKITYKGADWYVIENSSSNQDYVILLKEKVLTSEEIGNEYSATIVQYAQANKLASTMAYYWSSTCHNSGIYGSNTYESSDNSGCGGHNDYAGSKIKEVVDNYMTTNNMTNDLKEVDGYKIRLISIEELQKNFGLSTTLSSFAGDDIYEFETTPPSWLYSNLGSEVDRYWTMSQYGENKIWDVEGASRTYGIRIEGNTYGVRPVINLLKSAIPTQS